MFTAAKVNHFQAPPFERPGDPDVLLLRWYQDGDKPSSGEYGDVCGPNSWRFPTVGEFEHPGELEPWTDATDLVRLDASFKPPGVHGRDYMWIHPDFLTGCARPEILHPSVRPAARRLDGDPLDQILARIVACADSTSLKSGDDCMSAEIANYSLRQDSHAMFVNAQARADKVAQAFGDSAPRWVDGESLSQYRQRLLSKFKAHSADWKGVALAKLGDDVLGVAETRIYADAIVAATDPANVPAGQLREIIETDRSGRRISRFIGDPGACWDMFKQPARNVIGWNTK